VTPHNIFVTYDGQVKLLDFGIAKAATSSVKTATGVIKGKLTYMAPEQARGDPVDARADLYAVGVMLWEAATGRRRWPAGLTEPALFTRLATGELPEAPNVAALGYPAEIDGIIMRALAPDPNDRYQTAAELRDVLANAFRKMEPVSVRDLGGMLSDTFAEDRKRIRIVIEEQFRAIESGEKIPEPHHLPAVPHLSFITNTDSIDRNSPQGGSRATGNSAPDVLAESHSRRITAPAPDPKEVPSSRTRLAAVAAGVLILAAFGLGAAIQRLHAPAPVTPLPSASAVIAAVPPVSPSAVEKHPPPPVPDLPGENTAPNPNEAALAASAGHHGEGPGHHSAAPVANHEAAHPVASASAAAASVAPVVSAPPADTGDVVPLRTPQGRPKVQLERDNPWP
jgi:serine/threonine protein kinase